MHAASRYLVGNARIECEIGIADKVNSKQRAYVLVVCPPGNLDVSAPAKKEAIARLRVAKVSAQRRSHVVLVEVG